MRDKYKLRAHYLTINVLKMIKSSDRGIITKSVRFPSFWTLLVRIVVFAVK
jgi:hypothetical protein